MLVGEIPDCWNNSRIMIVNLSSNKLTGVIPPSLVSMDALMHLHLDNNKITGRIPSSISYLGSLRTLDLGGNEITGEIPIWPSHDELREFGILRLAGNKLNGSIPMEIYSLSTLYVLDLSNNQLTWKIPPCLGNISGFNNPGQDYGYGGTPGIVNTLIKNSINESITGIAREYNTILKYLSVIDISSNNLVGGIPKELTNLSGLLALNLSHNHLTGNIPYNIGEMKALETLDISRNKLFGRIPKNLGNLDFINHLNVSYNNLSGPIPTSRHLETLDDPSIYAGNPYLYGDPLPKKCWSHAKKPNEPDDKGNDESNEHEKMWFYSVVMLGFATGFWGVIETSLLKRSWRHSLFRLVEDALDWLYVTIVLRKYKFSRSSSFE